MYTTSCVTLNSSAFATQCIYVFSIVLKIKYIISLRGIYLSVLYNGNGVQEMPFLMHNLCQHLTNARFMHGSSIMPQTWTTIKNNIFLRKFMDLTLLLGTVLVIIKMVNARMRLDHVVCRLVQTKPRRVYSWSERGTFVTKSVGPRFVDGGPPFYLKHTKWCR